MFDTFGVSKRDDARAVQHDFSIGEQKANNQCRPIPVDRNPSSRLRFELFAGCAGFPIHGIPAEPIREILAPCILRVAGRCVKKALPYFPYLHLVLLRPGNPPSFSQSIPACGSANVLTFAPRFEATSPVN
jgi:hypothetical protein